MSTSTAAFNSFDIPKLLSQEQLQWWILFGICVAGKGAKQTQDKLNGLLEDMHTQFYPGFGPKAGPFTLVEMAVLNKNLLRLLKKHRIGQYKRIRKAFAAAVGLNLDQISVEALEAIPGIGPKTARMIVLYYDPNADCVPLDTHILKYLNANGVPAPKSTPPAGKTYYALERAFQAMAKLRQMTVRELDTMVWKSYAQKEKSK